MPGGRKGKAEQRLEAIRGAAYACFRDHGYHETSVDTLCKAAGISKGTFYWYYPSKQAVFVDIIEAWGRQVMDEIYVQFETAVTEQDYVAPVTQALHREVHRGRVIVPLWLEFTVHARREPEIREALARFYARARSAITEMLRPYVGQWMTEAEVRSIAGAIFGAYIGMVLQDVPDPDRADAKETMRQLMDFIGRTFKHLERTHFEGTEARISMADDDEDSLPGGGERVLDEDLDAFLAGVDDAAADRLRELRGLVLSTAPEADERIIRGWKSVCYDHGGLFCYLRPREDHVVLGFQNGARLDDPLGLLEGAGARMRFLQVPGAGPLDDESLGMLIQAAFDLQSR